MKISMSMGHDSSIVFYNNNKLKVIELERYFRVKSFDMFPWNKYRENNKESFCIIEEVLNLLKTKIPNITYDELSVSCYLLPYYLEVLKCYFQEYFKYLPKYIYSNNHRECHALSVYKISNLDDTLIAIIDLSGNGCY